MEVDRSPLELVDHNLLEEFKMAAYVSAEKKNVGNLGNFTAAVGGVKLFNAATETLTIPTNTVYFAEQIQGHMQTSGAVGTLTLERVSDATAVYAALVMSSLGSFAIDNQGGVIGPQIGPFSSAVDLQLALRSASPATAAASGIVLLQQAHRQPGQLNLA